MSSVRIKYLADVNRYVLPDSTDPDQWFRYVDISAVGAGGKLVVPEESVRFADAPSRARRVARPGDTVVSTVRTYLRAVARVPEVEGPLVFSTGFAVLGPKDMMEPRFLSYVCLSDYFIDEVAARSVGVSYPAVNPSDIGNIRIYVPVVDEQRRIANFLDFEVGHIDLLVAARCRQLELFDERVSSLLSERLIPGIVSGATGDFPWPWLPSLHEEAPLVRLGYVCQVQGGVTVDASRKPSEGDVTKPYLRVANVKADRLDLESVTSITVPKSVADRSTLLPGDVLMTEGGDIDKLGRGTVWRGEISDALHQNHVFALRPDPTRLDAEYLALLTRSVHGRCYFEATGVRSTNLASTSSSKVRSFPIPLPSLKEQRSAVIDVNRDLEGASRLRAALESQVALLEERKRALITAAVTGQIDVTTARGADVS